MIDIKFKDTEELEKEMLQTFSEMYEDNYPTILEWSHLELWTRSGKMFTTTDWKNFKTHPKMSEWYQGEMQDLAQQKAFRLLGKSGEMKSTGEAQQLREALQLLNNGKPNKDKQEKIVYAFIPLNVNEEAAPNVKILNNVPTEIKDAIQHVTPEGDKSE